MPTDLSRYEDDLPYPDALPGGQNFESYSPMQELGQTGLKRTAGYIDEEFLPALRGRKAIGVFREMSLNDPTVGALLFSIDKLLRQVTWRVEAPDNTSENTKATEFLEQCMEDMSHTWDDLVSEILSCLIYGWSWHEIVYKRRLGPWEKDPSKRSKHNDGLIGWRKMPIRAHETMQRWIFDDHGGIKAMVQMAPPHYKMTVLPISKSLLFRTDQSKGNPEGRSILRNAYRPYFLKKRLEEFEAIGVERDLAGMPVAKIPASYMNAQKGSKEHNTYMAFKKMVQNVRRDEHEGLVLPNQYDPETKQPLFEFELLSSAGSRTFDTNAIIQRHQQNILQTVLADFIMLGHEGQGSYAMHVDKTGIFRAALDAICETIADVFNRHAVPRLFQLNGWKNETLPRIVPNNVDPPNLTELAGFMTSMGGLGMEFFPDPDLEKFLRETAHLPELPEEMYEMKRQMAMQNSVMQYAEQQMMFMGVKQKAELTAQGYSPEQAQMASETETPEMMQAQHEAQATGHQSALQNPDVQAEEEMQRQQMEEEAARAAGDPEQKVAEASVDEIRAASDHKRALELKQVEGESAKESDTRSAKLKKEEDERSLRADKEKLKGQEKLARLKAVKKPGESTKKTPKSGRIKKNFPRLKPLPPGPPQTLGDEMRIQREHQALREINNIKERARERDRWKPKTDRIKKAFDPDQVEN